MPQRLCDFSIPQNQLDEVLAGGGHCQLGFLICTEWPRPLYREALCESPDRLRIVPIEGADVRQLIKVADRETVLWALVERAVLT